MKSKNMVFLKTFHLKAGYACSIHNGTPNLTSDNSFIVTLQQRITTTKISIFKNLVALCER